MKTVHLVYIQDENGKSKLSHMEIVEWHSVEFSFGKIKGPEMTLDQFLEKACSQKDIEQFHVIGEKIKNENGIKWGDEKV